MKTIILLLTACLLASVCDAQWSDATRTHGDDILTLGVQDTALLISFDAVGSYVLDRYTPSTGLHEISPGFEVVSMAVLGPNIFVSQFSSKISYSSNYGTTWQGGNAHGPLAGNDSILFAGIGTSLARSTDTGVTWVRTSAPAASQIAVAKQYAVASTSSGAYRTADNGLTWSKVEAPLLAHFNTLSRIGAILFTDGIGVLRSTDSGATWTTLSLVGDTVNATIAYKRALFVGTTTGIYLSKDSGKSWTNVTDNMTALPGFHPNVTHLAIIDTMLYAAVDAGRQQGSDFRSGYVTARSIPEMIGDSTSAVVTAPLASYTILVYPNPSSGMFTIEAPNVGLRSVVVLNLLGQELVRVENVGRDARPTRADLSALPSGTYFLRIETERGVVIRKVVRE